jgi:hypothetical protein
MAGRVGAKVCAPTHRQHSGGSNCGWHAAEPPSRSTTHAGGGEAKSKE